MQRGKQRGTKDKRLVLPVALAVVAVAASASTWSCGPTVVQNSDAGIGGEGGQGGSGPQSSSSGMGGYIA